MFLCYVLCLITQSCPSLWDPMNCSLPGSSVPGDFPGKNTRLGCHALLQGLFQTHGLNPGLLHSRRILYHLNHQGYPGILSQVAYIFSRGSSWPRNWQNWVCTKALCTRIGKEKEKQYTKLIVVALRWWNYG